MKYTFPDGGTKEIEFGSITKGIKRRLERPISVTLSREELVKLRNTPDYIHEIYQCLDARSTKHRSGKILMPLFFSDKEGGSWFEYTGTGFTEEQLARAVVGPLDYKKRNIEDKVLLIAYYKNIGTYIHSLAFTNPFFYREFARWDVVSGWTTELSDSE